MEKNTSLDLIRILFKECMGLNKSFFLPDGDRSLFADDTTAILKNTEDKGAVMYIVVVLVFYSMGIIIMIIKYLKTERQELEAQITLANFFKGLAAVRKNNLESNVNRVAIRACNTLLTVSSRRPNPRLLAPHGAVVMSINRSNPNLLAPHDAMILSSKRSNPNLLDPNDIPSGV